MLAAQQVEVLADVRSVTASRYSPHFNRVPLQQALRQKGMQYVWLEALGGRPKQRSYYDANGHADYRAMSQADFFLHDLERLKQGMEKYRVALMCSEENPNECHRRLLIVRTLCQHDPAYTDEIAHIRKGGILQGESDLQAAEQSSQLSLWRQEELWRSPKPILSIP